MRYYEKLGQGGISSMEHYEKVGIKSPKKINKMSNFGWLKVLGSIWLKGTKIFKKLALKLPSLCNEWTKQSNDKL